MSTDRIYPLPAPDTSAYQSIQPSPTDIAHNEAQAIAAQYLSLSEKARATLKLHMDALVKLETGA